MSCPTVQCPDAGNARPSSCPTVRPAGDAGDADAVTALQSPSPGPRWSLQSQPWYCLHSGHRVASPALHWPWDLSLHYHPTGNVPPVTMVPVTGNQHLRRTVALLFILRRACLPVNSGAASLRVSRGECVSSRVRHACLNTGPWTTTLDPWTTQRVIEFTCPQLAD